MRQIDGALGALAARCRLGSFVEGLLSGNGSGWNGSTAGPGFDRLARTLPFAVARGSADGRVHPDRPSADIRSGGLTGTDQTFNSAIVRHRLAIAPDCVTHTVAMRLGTALTKLSGDIRARGLARAFETRRFLTLGRRCGQGLTAAAKTAGMGTSYLSPRR